MVRFIKDMQVTVQNKHKGVISIVCVILDVTCIKNLEI